MEKASYMPASPWKGDESGSWYGAVGLTELS